MVFTNEDEILINVLRQSKGYSARKLLEKFPDKDWSCSALDWLLRQIDATVSADRKSGSSRERTVCTRDIQMSVQMATTLSTNLTNGIVYELLRRLLHIGNFCFWVPFFKQLLLKNYAVDFVEICNVCIRKAIIKAAKRIFNSDKICRSYSDLNFGVTFLEHSVVTLYAASHFSDFTENICNVQVIRNSFS